MENPASYAALQPKTESLLLRHDESDLERKGQRDHCRTARTGD